MSPDSIKEAGKLAGLSEEQIDKLLSQTEEQNIKDTLKQTTQEALDIGVSGRTKTNNNKNNNDNNNAMAIDT